MRQLNALRPRPALLALLLALANPLAADAADHVLTDITVTTAAGAYRIGTIDVRGTDLGRDEVQALFDAKARDPLAVRLARLSAREIVIPELVLEQATASGKRATVYRDIRFSDIRKGLAAKAATSGAVGTIERQDKSPQKLIMGPMTVEAVDLSAIARLMTETRGQTDAPALLAYKSLAVDGLRVTGEKSPVFEIGRMSGTDLAMRPQSEPLSALSKRFSDMQEKAKGGSPDFVAMFGALELIDGFEASSLEMTGIKFADTPESAAANDRKEAVSGSIGRIAVALPAKAPSTFSVEGIDITSDKARVKFDALKLDGFSVKPTLEGLRAWLARPEPRGAAPDAAKMIPKLGALRLEGITVEPKDGKSAGPITLRGFELTLADPFEGIPTRSRIAIEGLAAPLNLDKPDKSLQDLIAMGYARINVSAAFEAAWSEPTRQVAIRTLEFAGLDMLDFRSNAILGNVPKEAFSTDKAIAQVAWLGATARQLELSLVNKGFFERLLAREAKKAGQSPEDLRSQWGMMAMIGASAALGDSEGAKALAAAVSRFIAKPGKLSISVKARNPAGLGLADVIAAGEPKAIFEKLDVTAKAE